MSKKNLSFQNDIEEIEGEAAEFEQAFARVQEKRRETGQVSPAAPETKIVPHAKSSPREKGRGEKTEPARPGNAALETERNRDEFVGLPDEEMVVQLSTKITRTLLDRLEQSYLERRRRRAAPWKKQEIVMAALSEWFERNGH